MPKNINRPIFFVYGCFFQFVTKTYFVFTIRGTIPPNDILFRGRENNPFAKNVYKQVFLMLIQVQGIQGVPFPLSNTIFLDRITIIIDFMPPKVTGFYHNRLQ